VHGSRKRSNQLRRPRRGLLNAGQCGAAGTVPSLAGGRLCRDVWVGLWVGAASRLNPQFDQRQKAETPPSHAAC
jgi:hypothetical protein